MLQSTVGCAVWLGRRLPKASRRGAAGCRRPGLHRQRGCCDHQCEPRVQRTCALGAKRDGRSSTSAHGQGRAVGRRFLFPFVAAHVVVIQLHWSRGFGEPLALADLFPGRRPRSCLSAGGPDAGQCCPSCSTQGGGVAGDDATGVAAGRLGVRCGWGIGGRRVSRAVVCSRLRICAPVAGSGHGSQCVARGWWHSGDRIPQKGAQPARHRRQSAAGGWPRGARLVDRATGPGLRDLERGRRRGASQIHGPARGG
mmetsp:Transcript_7257/g.18326  ORF Transcript_7257/g.18326 Transcript_7257/m.18326 type:complete len:254 (+) Transcript_7257:372-1133(+)